MTAKALKPCPFCGGPAQADIQHIREDRDDLFQVGCYNVGCFNPTEEGWGEKTFALTIEEWNKRGEFNK